MNKLTQKLSEKYPWLIQDNNLLIPLEIPVGWTSLFILLCEEVNKILEGENYKSDFKIFQVKEKFGNLVCYTNNAHPSIQTVLDKFEHLSQFVCCECGQAAKFVTTGYICPYCDKCIKQQKGPYREKILNLKVHYTVFKDGKKNTVEINCEDVFNNYFGNIVDKFMQNMI